MMSANSKSKFELVATVFDRKGNILSKATNSYQKSHTIQARYAKRVGLEDKIFLHAEIAALIKCRGIPYKIKIERYSKKGEPLLAKPCPICELAIKEAGIHIVEYTI